MRAVASGMLRMRLEIQEPVERQLPTGEVVRAWETFDFRWGGVRPLQGRELVEAQAVTARATHRVSLRGVEIGPRSRLRLGTRVFEILDRVDVEERGRLFELTCFETIPPEE